MRSVCWLLIPILMFFDKYARAELTFGPREKVPMVNSPSENEVGMSVFVVPDEQTEVMVFGRSGGAGYHDFWQSSRVVPDGQWTQPVPLRGHTSSSYYEDIPHLTTNGLTLLLDDGLWFGSVPQRPNGFGAGDIWMATRETTADPFGAPENVGETVNSRYYDGGATLSADGLTLLFDSRRQRGGGIDLWMASRDAPDMPWNEPVNLGDTINSRSNEMHPAISSDALRLFFSSDRSGSYDIWMSNRDTPRDPWNAPVQLDENVNHPQYMEVAPTLSPDGSTLYLSANLSPEPIVLTWDIYQVPIFLQGDFDGNGLWTAGDIDLLAGEILSGANDPAFDLNADALVDTNDRNIWVQDLKSTYFGDAELDGSVQFSDFLALSDAFGREGGWSHGDFDGDGIVQFSDFLLLSNDFGRSQQAVAAVPEPSTALLGLIGLVVCLRRSKSKHQ